MKKLLLFLSLLLFVVFTVNAQTTETEIGAGKMATFTVPNTAGLDSLTAAHAPYANYLGVRRVIVADPNKDGVQEIIATDYSNGGRVHVLKYNAAEKVLEIIWSSPVDSHGGKQVSPRYPRVADCDGDGNPEIIFERNYYVNPDSSVGRMTFYEWNGTDWGTEPAFYISAPMLTAAGGREGMRFFRDYLAIEDVDGDGKPEIIPHGNSPRSDVLILSIEGSFPGFASIKIEGGKPGEQINGGDWGVGMGSYYNSVLADLNGDGKKEIVNHHWDKYAFWSIAVNGPDSYTYPEATDLDDAMQKGVYHKYFSNADGVSYFGVTAADVNGDGIDEIFGTVHKHNHDLVINSFAETKDKDKGIYRWDSTSQTKNFAIIKESAELAQLAGKTKGEFWTCVKGDLNKDGKDEIYTGSSSGLNVLAIQYKGEGSLLDKNSYTANVVYKGDAGDVFAEYNIYNGKATFTYDTTVISQDSIKIDTSYTFDPSVIDTVRKETPFTSYIYADSVDLDNDGKMEFVLAEQSVYDSITVKTYNWNDERRDFDLDTTKTLKIFNNYRTVIRLFEYDGGVKVQKLGIIYPEDYKLSQNYPNPFNPTTTIHFKLPIDKKVSFIIYDMLGRKVRTLIDNVEYKKGEHPIVWDGTDGNGRKVSSGHYIGRLTFGNFAKEIKMTLLK